MFFSIIDNYRESLRRYQLNKEAKYPQQAKMLEDAFASVHSFASLVDFFKKPLPLRSYLCFFSRAISPSDRLVKAYKNLQATVQALPHYNIPALSASLSELGTHPRTVALVEFVRNLLNLSDLFLHEGALQLLQLLSARPSLDNMMRFLENQPTAENSKPLHEGSFSAITPSSKEHAICLGLLRNNSALLSNKLDADTGALAQTANTFLQLVLQMNKEALDSATTLGVNDVRLV